MTNRLEYLYDVERINGIHRIYLADNKSIIATHTGKMNLNYRNGSVDSTITLSKVIYSKELCKTLFSVTKAMYDDLSVLFENHSCTITDSHNIGCPLRAVPDGGLWRIQSVNSSSSSANIAFHNDLDLLHYRMGHISPHVVNKLAQKQGISSSGEVSLCEHCIIGKSTRKPFPKSDSVATRPLQIVVSDICGPFNVKSIHHHYYFMTCIDVFSRYCYTFLLKSRRECFDTFKKFALHAQNLTGHKIAILRSDNEYRTNNFAEFCAAQGIVQQFTNSYSSQQNGISERKNLTLMNSARSMLLAAKLSKMYWGHAVLTATHILNRVPSSHNDKTSLELFTGQVPDLSYLKVFGCVAYAHVPEQLRSKLDPRAEKCRFLGYGHDQGVKSYIVQSLSTRKIYHSHDVRFDERSILNLPDGPTDSSPFFELDSSVEDANRKENIPIPDILITVDRHIDDNVENDDANLPLVEQDEQPLLEQDEPPPLEPADPQPPPRISDRPNKGTSHRYDDYVLSATGRDDIPTTYKAAMASPDVLLWKAAMDAEMASHEKNGTYKLVSRNTDQNVIGCKWVYKIKYNADGSINCYKARLVALGYRQKQGIDYDDVFAPVARFASLRLLLTIAASLDLDLHHMDVKTAFLNSHTTSNIFMSPPPGYNSEDGKVCKLMKSLYGLKQSPREWNLLLKQFFLSIGYTQMPSEPCIYTHREENNLVIVLIYVDDIIIASNNSSSTLKLKAQLASMFEMSDLGELKYFLGFEIKRNRTDRTIHMSQRHYIVNVLEKFGMSDCNISAVPLDANVKFIPSLVPTTDESKAEMTHYPYRKLVGSLGYLSTGTRPDISFIVSMLSRHLHNPGMAHWNYAKQVLRYLKGTQTHGLILGGKDIDFKLCAYADASWADDLINYRSTSGFVIKCNDSVINWRSQREATAALSSTEAEYMSLSECAQDIYWFRQMLTDFGYAPSAPILLHEDNQGCIAIAKDPVDHHRIRHVAIKYHFVREAIDNKTFDIVFVPTASMIADGLTKLLPRPAHSRLVAALRISPSI